MGSIVEVNPFRCRVWADHERLEEHITDQSCKAEIQSFTERGQQIPALGRRVRDQADPMCEIELIYGARRLYVARHLNMPLRVEIREMSDRDAAVAMDIENRQRLAASPYERGLSYSRWLKSGVFASQDEIASALRISSSQVSRLLKLAHLPTEILGAFESPLDILETWGLDLHQAWQDPQRRSGLRETACAIRTESPRPEAERVYERLMGPAQGRRLRVRTVDEVVRDVAGRPLFRVRRARNNFTIILDAGRLSRESLNVLKTLISERLQAATRQVTESQKNFTGSALVRVTPGTPRGIHAPDAFHTTLGTQP
jgi:ParB family transcriptional regulator, chromosome partitioning protein